MAQAVWSQSWRARSTSLAAAEPQDSAKRGGRCPPSLHRVTGKRDTKVSRLQGPALALNCLRDGLVVGPALPGPEARGMALALPPTDQVALGHCLPLPGSVRPR